MENVIIIGSGPAAYSAAIYTARAELNPLLISGFDEGGQLMLTFEVENYPGFSEISGPDLMKNMKNQAEKCGTRFLQDYVTEVDFSSNIHKITTEFGEKFESKTVIIATGAQARWLGNPSEEKFKGYGVSACATCDGAFYKDKIVAVIGGGNTAVEEAIFLTRYAKKVYLIHRRDSLKAEKIMQKRLFENEKIEMVWNCELSEVLGNEDPKSVTGIKLNSTNGESAKSFDIDGLFIAIGHKPSTEIFKKYLDIDKSGYINTISGTPKTNIKGVFAAGDVQDKVYKQAITAAGSGCMAALEVERYIDENK